MSYPSESENTPLYQAYSECHNNLVEIYSHIKGELFTLADSSFSDPQQRKAFKDLACQSLDRLFREGIRDTLVRTFKKVSEITTKEGLFEYYGKDCPIDQQSIVRPRKLPKPNKN